MTKLRLLLLATTALTAMQFAGSASHAESAPLVMAQAQKEELGPDGKPKQPPKEAPKPPQPPAKGAPPPPPAAAPHPAPPPPPSAQPPARPTAPPPPPVAHPAPPPPPPPPAPPKQPAPPPPPAAHPQAAPEQPHALPKELPREQPKEQLREQPREQPRELPKEQKELPREQKEPPRETPTPGANRPQPGSPPAPPPGTVRPNATPTGTPTTPPAQQGAGAPPQGHPGPAPTGTPPAPPAGAATAPAGRPGTTPPTPPAPPQGVGAPPSRPVTPPPGNQTATPPTGAAPMLVRRAPPQVTAPLPPPPAPPQNLTPLPAGAAAQGPRRLDDFRAERREVQEGGRTVITEPGRVIIRDPSGESFVRHDELERFRYGARNIETQRVGADTRTIMIRPDGSQVITVIGPDGSLLRRIRRDPRGEEFVIIDNSYRDPRAVGGFYVDLPPPVVRIPYDRYIVDASDAPPDLIYETMEAPPVDRIERRYSLDEIRYSPNVRMLMPSIDVNTINFDIGSWEISPDQDAKLQAIADGLNRAIQRNPREVFLIEGHTDATGNDTDNLSLSDRRAESAAELLTQQFQVPAENLTSQGYGSQYLKEQTDGPSRINRRVTIRRITPLLTGSNSSLPPPPPGIAPPR